jgi:Asp-tRNA(Asn)/Glu-tRNA(Gln) amidotransferase A subunit family amidase
MQNPAPPVNDEDLCYRPAHELAALIRDRTVSPVEVVEAIARRIEAVNPGLNAYCTLDLDRARDEAQVAEQVVMHRGERKPLLGVPVAIKDDLAVKGLRYTGGSRLFADVVAEYDDEAVARLRRSGAIILGKTNLPEIGHKGTTDNVLFGTTANPWDLGRSAGGSSGGSGSAVAAGLAYLALGTDIAGSIRIPASFCGVVGHKPTTGRVPRVPAGNAFVTAWAIGPLARNVTDTALAMKVLSGPDDRDPLSLPPLPGSDWDLEGDLKGLRVAWCSSPTGGPVEEAVARAARGAVAHLERLGASVVPLARPYPSAPFEALLAMFRTEVLRTTGIADNADFRAKRDLLTPTFAAFIEPGLDLTLRDLIAGQVAVTEFLETVAGPALAGFDLLATPTVAVPAFSKDLPLGPDRVAGEPIHPHLSWCFTWPFNLTGQPAVSIPCGWSPEGLPVGLQLAGPRGADARVLLAARAIERAAPWATRRPLP